MGARGYWCVLSDPTFADLVNYVLFCRSVLTCSSQSYICGATNVYAWIAGTSGVAILLARGFFAAAIFYDPEYTPKTWHYFLVFQAVNLLSCLHNIFTLRRTLWINDMACKCVHLVLMPLLKTALCIISTCPMELTPRSKSF